MGVFQTRMFLVCMVINHVNSYNAGLEHIRNLLNSVAKKNDSEIKNNQNIIREDVLQEEQAFNSMKRELQFGHRRTYLTRNKRDDGKNEEPTSMGRVTEEPIRKTLPVGSDFREIIQGNMIYVDKTDIIHTMITTGKYVFLSRPPRFGKSLLVSTLYYLFEGGPSNKELFSGTKIQNATDYDFPVHTVLQFDFSRLASNTLIRFTASLQNRVRSLSKANGIDEQRCVDEMEPKECLDQLLETLNEKKEAEQSRIVVLIDEYDVPWRNFDGNEEDRKEMLKIMRGFFKILKSYNLRFCFVTGSTKTALTEFFSGYNCAKDISWLPKYESIVGLSTNELRTYFDEYVKDHAMKKGVLPDEIYRLLDSHFEGYRFSLKNAKMYNSLDVIDFLGETEPKDISSYHAKADSKYVVGVIQNLPRITLALDLMATLKTEDDFIPVDVGFIRGFKDSFPAPKAALKVLYEGGYHSVKKHESVELSEPDKYYIGFTNKVTRNHFHKLIEEALEIRHYVRPVTTSDPGFKEPLQKRDIPAFSKRVETHCMKVPYLLTPSDEIKKTEALYQAVIFFGLYLSGYEPSWETILRTGRLDVQIADESTVFIFELKLKSNPEVSSMMRQCEGYSRAAQYDEKRIVCIGIVFHDAPTIINEAIYQWEISDRLPGKKCQFCPDEDFPNESAFIQHLRTKHGSDQSSSDSVVTPKKKQLLAVSTLFGDRFLHVFLVRMMNSEEDIVDGNDSDLSYDFMPNDTQAMEKAHFNKMMHQNIREANLTDLVSHLEWTHEMKDGLVEQRSRVLENKPVSINGIALQGSRDELLPRFDSAIVFIDRYIHHLEKALRDPKKTWNYPKTDGNV